MGNLPHQVHVHDTSAFHDDLTEANEKLSALERTATTTTITSFSTNDHSSHLSHIDEKEELTSDIDSTVEIMTGTVQTAITHDKMNQTLTQHESKVNHIRHKQFFKDYFSSPRLTKQTVHWHQN